MRNQHRNEDLLLNKAFRCWDASRSEPAATKAALDTKMAAWLARARAKWRSAATGGRW